MRYNYRPLLLPSLLAASFLEAHAATASSVTLTSSPNPSTYGRTVSLTATVTAGASGKITFYDGAIALGTAPVVAGTASFSTPSLGAGVRRLTAYYRGDPNFSASTSAVCPHTVQAVYGNVFGATTYTPGLLSYQVNLAVADFNHDGKSDLVWAGLQGAGVLLGNGDGTFQAARFISFGVGVPVAHPLAIADFDGDGNLDIALAQQNPAVVFMLLGNGDGSFRTGISLNTASIPESLAQGDFNGDGNVDLLVMEWNKINLYRGTGDGNFLPPVDCAVSGNPFRQMAVGDFNGDRKADLVVIEGTVSGAGAIKVLMGNGDGSFRSPVLFDAVLAEGVLVEDFDRDGLDDIAIGVGNSVQILLGTSDGAMRNKGSAPLPGYVNAMLAKGDFDGDGRIDLICAIQTGEIVVLPSNGDGTFNGWAEYAARNPSASSIAEGDFNGDGRIDVALSEYSVGITVLNNVSGTIARSGTPQSAFLGQAFPSPLAVTITDLVTGSPVSGATVLYSHPGFGADAALSSSTAVTNAAGVASVSATANNIAGTYNVFAFTGTLYFNIFQLTNVADTPASLTTASGTPQSAAAGMPFTVPLKVLLKSSSGRPVSGAAVSFSAPWGIQLSSTTATTDASGLAHVWATAGSQPATYSVAASSSGLSASFDLTVLSPVAVSLATSPNPSIFGQSVTLTATVPAGVTGKVTFYDGPAVLGTATVAGQTASRSTILLPSGARTLTARYNGDSGHPASRSNSVTQTVTATPNPSLTFGSATPIQETYGSRYPAGGIVADFDGDGKADIAVANCAGVGPGSVSVLLGNGDGTFRSGGNTPVSVGVQFLAAGDFNGDAKMDLAVTILGGGLVVLLGNGDGTMTVANSYAPGSASWEAVTDLDRDGRADLVGLNSSTHSLMVLLGNGDGTFQSAVAYDTGAQYPNSLLVADFNGDGTPDFALTHTGYTYAVSILMGNPDGTLQPVRDVASAAATRAVAAGDFNGDGKADLIALGYEGWSVLIGNGDGSFYFQSYVSYPTWVDEAVVADFNGDGKMDAALVYGNSGSQGVLLLLGNGDGSLQSPIAYQGSSSFRIVGAGEFTGGGKTDLALLDTPNRSVQLLRDPAPGVGILSTHTAYFWQGLIGAGYILTVTNNQATATAGVIAVTDILPAGLTATAIVGTGWTCDLPTLTCTRSDSLAPGASYPPIVLTVNIASNAVAQVTNSATVSVAGAVTGVTTDPTAITGSLRPTTITLTASPNPANLGQSVTLTARAPAGVIGLVVFYDGASILGSSTLDINQNATLTTNTLPAGTRLLHAYFRGNGVDAPSASATVSLVVRAAVSQGFSPLGGYTVAGNAYSIAAADLNGDGKADLAIANGSGISVLSGSGNATFQPPVDYTASRASTFVASGDFNADGKADLVTANPDGNDVTVFLANADGSLQTGANYPSGASPHSVAIGDLDGDGFLDLAAPNFTTATLTILLGKGDGTFRQFVTYPVAAAPYYVVIGDFNGDAKPDLAVTSSTGSITILLAKGNGIFQTSAGVAVGGSPIGIATGDFNSDGKLDLAVAGASANNATVLLGNGDGTFRAPVNYPAGGNSVALATGDFNGDGNLDVAVANSSSAGASVLFGNGDGSFKPPAVYAGGFSSTAVAVADFNGDGRADLAVTTGNTGFVASPHLSRAVARALNGSSSNNVLIFQGAASVAPIATSATVQSSANPAVVNQAVAFTAYLTPPAATGSVQFVIDGNNFGDPVTVSGGTAISGPISSLAVGNHTVTANFVGTGNYANSGGSVSGGLTVSAGFTAALSGAIASKQGPANARVWTFTVTYTGSGAVSAAQISGLTLTQTGLGGGQACSPAILTPFPVLLGAIPPGGFAQGSITVDFTGCANAASFSVHAQLSANNGALTGSISRNHQYR